MEEAGVGSSVVGSGVGGGADRVFPPDLVDEVIAEVGRTEQRNRSVPARVLAYFSIGIPAEPVGSRDCLFVSLPEPGGTG